MVARSSRGSLRSSMRIAASASLTVSLTLRVRDVAFTRRSLLPGDLDGPEGLDGVAFVDVLEALDADAALIARLHGLHVVLEAPERMDLALEHNGTLPDDAHLIVTRDLTVLHEAAGDGAELRDFEQLADVDVGGIVFFN